MPWAMSSYIRAAGHSLGKEKATLGFRIYKIWQILKRFGGAFHRTQTLKFGGVICRPGFSSLAKFFRNFD